MSRAVKIWLIIAASLVLLGGIIFCGVMTVLNWNFGNLGTSKMTTNSYDIIDIFKSVSVDTSEANIVILKSDDEKCKVACYERENMRHDIGVVNGVLTVKVRDDRKWYNYIGIFNSHPTITLYLPRTEYDLLSVKGNTGDVGIPSGLKFESIDISLSTGDVNNYASVSKDARIKVSTGNIFIEDTCVGSLELSTSTGAINVKSVACDDKIEVKVTTGKAKFTDVSCKSFASKGSTGEISLKSTVASEKLSIERSTMALPMELSFRGYSILAA